MSTIIELATGSNKTDTFGSGVNKALNVEAKSVFEIKEGLANFRKFAARIEATSEAIIDMEKFGSQTLTSGGDLEDGTDATFTVIDNQSLITFDTPTAVSVGFKLTPKLLRQARQDPEAFMARYRRKIAFDLARKEDAYIGSVLINGATNTIYAGNATTDAGLSTGSVMTIELFERMLDNIKDREYEPTDFIGTSKLIGQLRRDARLLNDSDFSVAIKEDGSTVTQIGDVTVQEVKGTTIISNYATDGTGSGTSGIMMDKEGCFGVADFLKSEGASPITISVGTPDPTLAGANYHRILGQQELQAKVLDQNSYEVVRVHRGV